MTAKVHDGISEKLSSVNQPNSEENMNKMMKNKSLYDINAILN